MDGYAEHLRIQFTQAAEIMLQLNEEIVRFVNEIWTKIALLWQKNDLLWQTWGRQFFPNPRRIGTMEELFVGQTSGERIASEDNEVIVLATPTRRPTLQSD